MQILNVGENGDKRSVRASVGDGEVVGVCVEGNEGRFHLYILCIYIYLIFLIVFPAFSPTVQCAGRSITVRTPLCLTGSCPCVPLWALMPHMCGQAVLAVLKFVCSDCAAAACRSYNNSMQIRRRKS